MGIEDYREELKVCVIAWIIVVVLLVVFICSSCNMQEDFTIVAKSDTVTQYTIDTLTYDAIVVHDTICGKDDTVYNADEPKKIYITKTITIHDTITR